MTWTQKKMCYSPLFIRETTLPYMSEGIEVANYNDYAPNTPHLHALGGRDNGKVWTIIMGCYGRTVTFTQPCTGKGSDS